MLMISEHFVQAYAKNLGKIDLSVASLNSYQRFQSLILTLDEMNVPRKSISGDTLILILILIPVPYLYVSSCSNFYSFPIPDPDPFLILAPLPNTISLP
jgi:hypothetical protein